MAPEDRFTEADVHRYAYFVAGHPDARVGRQHLNAARAILDGLAQDGRLLPPGGEVSTQYGVRWHAVPDQDEWDDWGFHDEAQVRQEMASSPTPSTLLRRRTITLPVEPVLSDNSEGGSGA